jgi:hypothetical protein
VSNAAASLKAKLTGNAMLPKEEQVPDYVGPAIARAEERLQAILPSKNEGYEFWRGNQYAYVDSKNALRFLPTRTTPNGGGKRPWQSRSVNNLIMDIVQHEVSAVTQRIPSYEVTPTASDPDKRSAAKTAEHVALYGYEQWGVGLAAVKAVTHAVVGGEAFAWPYFDTTVGPMIADPMDPEGKAIVGRGEVKVKVYGPQDVMWEPGVRFEDSQYHVVVQDMTMLEFVNIPGSFGKIASPDSDQQRSPRRSGWGKANKTELIRVYNYLEKPTRSYPRGRWLVIANGRLAAAERAYPVPEGDALVPLSYIVDPDNDRDQSLVQHLMDPQRVYNDAWNKIVEWKNYALNPQLFVAPGVLNGQVITSEPGAVYTMADPKNNLVWRDVPALPQELFQIAQEMTGVIARLAAQNDIPSQVEAGRAIQALIEKDANRRQSFIASVARWHGAVASRSLYLVQQHYTEPRLLRIKGRWSSDTIADFKGAQLLGQTDVRVAPGSIEPRTRVAMEQKVLAFADRGWITAEAAIAAIEGGTAADLVTSYELDIGRAERIIARLKQGEEALFGTPEEPIPSRIEIDPMTGAQTEVPDYMPRAFDNIPVQKGVFEDWMKTEEFESQPPEIQGIAQDVYLGMTNSEAFKAAQAAQQEAAVAEEKGMQGAAGGISQPDAPGGTDGEQGLPTPNQPANQNVPDRGGTQ